MNEIKQKESEEKHIISKKEKEILKGENINEIKDEGPEDKQTIISSKGENIDEIKEKEPENKEIFLKAEEQISKEEKINEIKDKKPEDKQTIISNEKQI